MSKHATIAQVTDESLPEVLHTGRSVIILTRTDCRYCTAYLAEVEALIEQGPLAGIIVGTLLLDQTGASRFKRENPWVSRLDFLPYNLIYRNGRRVDGFAGSRASYLVKRVEAALSQQPEPGAVEQTERRSS